MAQQYNLRKSVPLEDPKDARREGLADALGRAKNRRRRREEHARVASKLSPGDLEEMRRDRAAGMKLHELRDKYGLSLGQISKLTRGWPQKKRNPARET